MSMKTWHRHAVRRKQLKLRESDDRLLHSSTWIENCAAIFGETQTQTASSISVQS